MIQMTYILRVTLVSEVRGQIIEMHLKEITLVWPHLVQSLYANFEFHCSLT